MLTSPMGVNLEANPHPSSGKNLRQLLDEVREFLQRPASISQRTFAAVELRFGPGYMAKLNATG